MKNEMEIVFDAVSENEGFARIAVAAFATQKNPTLEELADIKTAVSEAVTNAIIHGYETGQTNIEKKNVGKIRLHCLMEEGILLVEVEDRGKGIEDVEKAMEPLFTTKPDLERSGMGFSFMEAFMDELEVKSKPGEGTLIIMKKKMDCGSWIENEE